MTQLIEGYTLSCSLYGLALTGYTGFAPLTPVGGLSFIIGWVALGWAAWRIA